jgi:hypothetical protein
MKPTIFGEHPSTVWPGTVWPGTRRAQLTEVRASSGIRTAIQGWNLSFYQVFVGLLEYYHNHNTHPLNLFMYYLYVYVCILRCFIWCNSQFSSRFTICVIKHGKLMLDTPPQWRVLRRSHL